ncbi:NAD-dependent protein deacetylase sirtuin-3, mitochondrial isoform X3 [Mobula birostris]|uniref:NAD-dependent protein deacetylase sirtuin-3, mitochondrial isoform X3 n=1 Tax=Mobula birostris TaxID=1983395 RepID=UPI003B28DAEF
MQDAVCNLSSNSLQSTVSPCLFTVAVQFQRLSEEPSSELVSIHCRWMVAQEDFEVCSLAPQVRKGKGNKRDHCVSSWCICPPVRSIFRGKSSDEKVQSLQDIASLIQSAGCSKIVVMSGAGISTPSGIPDFRSPGSGLYDNLQQYDVPYPEAVFDIGYFAHNPEPFFAVARQLYPGHCKPNFTHYFVRMLYQKGLLLRMYTQNIDGLERRAGIPPQKLVEAHGTFATATCTVCRGSFTWEQLQGDVMEGKVPHCSSCSGVIKPDIVFFGEQLPRKFYQYLIDFPLADLLIILGTSLEVLV